VCLLPEFMIVFFNITFQLGGTALLIVVVVAMDFMSQVQAHLMSSQYAKLMEKSNLKSYGRSTDDSPVTAREDETSESKSISQKDVPPLQGDQAPWRGESDLQRRAPAQAASGLSEGKTEHLNGTYRRYQRTRQQARGHRPDVHLRHWPNAGPEAVQGAGVDPSMKIQDLTDERLDALRSEVGKLTVEGDLRRETP
jgi:hypothetical protein